MNKAHVGLIATCLCLAALGLFFIVFGNKEGSFKYYPDGLTIIINNDTDASIQHIHVSTLDGGPKLQNPLTKVQPYSEISFTDKKILPQNQDLSLQIQYQIDDNELQQLAAFPYIDSLESKYILKLDFETNKDGTIKASSSGLNDGTVFLKETLENH